MRPAVGSILSSAGSIPNTRVSRLANSSVSLRSPRQVASAAGLAPPALEQCKLKQSTSDRVLSGSAASTSEPSTRPPDSIDWSSDEEGLRDRIKLSKFAYDLETANAARTTSDQVLEPSTRRSRSKTRRRTGLVLRPRLRRAADGRARARRGVSSATTASRAAEGTKSQDTATRSEQPHFLSRQAEADACAAVQELKRLKAVEQPSLTAWALLAGERYEQALSAKLAQGNAAAERLVEANKGLIMLFVKRYTSQGVDADDLYVAGASGLLNAAENFDPARGMRLMTLAYLSIPRAMTRAVEQMGSVVRLPTGTGEALRKIYRTKQRLAEQLGRAPTSAEVAAATGISENRMQDLVRGQRLRPKSLDTPLQGRKDDDAEKTLADVIADGAADGSADPEQEMWGEVMQRHFKDDLEAILDTLPNSKDRQVLALLYGLYEYQRPHTLREVGEKLQLSHERVRQLKNACMDRLKETGRLEPLLVYLEGGSRMR